MAPFGTRAWGSPLQRHRGEARRGISCVAYLHCSPRRDGATSPRAPQAMMSLPLSLKDIPRSDCNKGMRCLSSRGLAEPAALRRASSTGEYGASGHHSSTEGGRMFDMSASLSPKKSVLRDSGPPGKQHLSVRCQCLPQAAVAASTHQDGWSRESHPEGCFNVLSFQTTPNWELAHGMLCIRGSILVSKLKVPDPLSWPCCSCVLQA